MLPAVFKTVCGALLRRPGWVRFPSIPAKFGVDDSQVDSQTRKRFSESFAVTRARAIFYVCRLGRGLPAAAYVRCASLPIRSLAVPVRMALQELGVVPG